MVSTNEVCEYMVKVRDGLSEIYGDDYEDYVDVESELTFHAAYRALCEGVSVADFINIHF